VTLGEGEEYWEKFGHNALWFSDPTRGIDVAYNWGTFDFAAPGYLRRLLTGDTRYWVEGVPGPLFLDFYRQYDRTIIVQRLNLTPEQARKAYEYSLWNAREENKYYRYDYFRDNCSTRVRDVIDLAVGGALKTWTASTVVERTYRQETVRLVDDMKLVQLGVDLALGQPADKQLTLWEDMFAPSRMRDALRAVRVSVDGEQATLVAEERVLYESKHHEERQDFPDLKLAYLVIGLLLAMEFLVIGWAGERSGAAEKVYRIEVAVWAFLTGLLGVVLLLAWLITQHVFWYRNENLLLVSPLSLWLAVVLPLTIWRPRYLRPAAILGVVIAAFAVVALLVKPLPGFTQDNLALVLLLLPPHAAIAYGLRRRRKAASPAA
jgi:hypothetical protein